MPRHDIRNLVRTSLGAAALGVLAACGGVQIKPEPALPKPLVQTIPTRVGLVFPGDMKNIEHNETRWGVDWKITLGEGHARLMRDIFKAEFDQVQEFADLDAARAAPGLKAVFEPRIEQYSFVTARETGGRYYAVTIRYRINLYTPTGEQADTFTLTGYGNALAKGMSSGKPLQFASVAAMRDAAAKFLVQFPEQPAGAQLAKNEAVVVEKVASVGGTTGGVDIVETVPIEEPKADVVPPAPAPVTGPSAPAAPAPVTPVAGKS
jgi:hypothetical protein